MISALKKLFSKGGNAFFGAQKAAVTESHLKFQGDQFEAKIESIEREHKSKMDKLQSENEALKSELNQLKIDFNILKKENNLLTQELQRVNHNAQNAKNLNPHNFKDGFYLGNG